MCIPNAMASRAPLGAHFSRLEIVGAAAVVFAKKGLANCTVEDILRAAKVSRRTFYRSFKNKQQVLEALYTVATRTLIDALRAAANRGDTWQAKIEASVDAYLEVSQSAGGLYPVLAAEAMRPDSLLAPHRAAAQDELARIMVEQIATARGGERVDELLCRTLVVSLEGAMTLLQTDGHPDPDQLAHGRRVMLRIMQATLARDGDDVRAAACRVGGITMNDHLIIGAGFSGLPIAKKLKELGESFDIIDKNSGIGGLWHTGVYRDAHTISSKRATEFPDYPMPASYPDFPSRAQMQAYFEDYAHAFGLDRHITLKHFSRPCTAVGRTTRAHGVGMSCSSKRVAGCKGAIARSRWRLGITGRPNPCVIRDVSTARSCARTSTGVLSSSRASAFSSSATGNTGCDIAVDAGRVGARAAISMRSGAWFFPKMFCGVPLADIPQMFPPWLRFDAIDQLLGRFITAFAVGDLSRYGVPQPRFRHFEKHPIINTDLIRAIRHGRVHVRPDVARLDGHRVSFVDGTSEAFDCLVYATGYRIHFPMLDPADALLRLEGGRPVLLLGLAAPDHRGLFVPGLGQARTGGGPLFQESGYCVARMIAHEMRSTDGLRADASRLREVRAAQHTTVQRLLDLPLVGPGRHAVARTGRDPIGSSRCCDACSIELARLMRRASAGRPRSRRRRDERDAPRSAVLVRGACRAPLGTTHHLVAVRHRVSSWDKVSGRRARCDCQRLPSGFSALASAWWRSTIDTSGTAKASPASC